MDGIANIHYVNCDESLCSLGSIVSSDFNSWQNDVDDCLTGTTVPNAYSVFDKGRFYGLDPASSSNPLGYVPCVSQRSMNTEMTIVASTSPEIVALNLPVTPTFPKEINFASSHRRQDSLDSLFSVDSRSPSDSSDVEHPFVSPMMARRLDHQHGYADRMQCSSESPLDRAGGPEHSALMEEADALCLSLKRHSLDGVGTQEGSNHKENVHANLSSSGSSFEPRNKLSRGHGSRHLTSPAPDRSTFHRRVSFSSLPSPAEIASPDVAEIASPDVASPSTHPHVSEHKASSITDDGGAEPLWFPSNSMDLTS